MGPFSLGQAVSIKINGHVGMIIGIWHGLHQETRYLTRYADTTGRVAEDWFWADDLRGDIAAVAN